MERIDPRDVTAATFHKRPNDQNEVNSPNSNILHFTSAAMNDQNHQYKVETPSRKRYVTEGQMDDSLESAKLCNSAGSEKDDVAAKQNKSKSLFSLATKTYAMLSSTKIKKVKSMSLDVTKWKEIYFHQHLMLSCAKMALMVSI